MTEKPIPPHFGLWKGKRTRPLLILGVLTILAGLGTVSRVNVRASLTESGSGALQTAGTGSLLTGSGTLTASGGLLTTASGSALMTESGSLPPIDPKRIAQEKRDALFLATASKRRSEAQHVFTTTLADATQLYQSLLNVQQAANQYEANVRQATRDFSALMREKRGIRLQIAALRVHIATLRTLAVVKANQPFFIRLRDRILHFVGVSCAGEENTTPSWWCPSPTPETIADEISARSVTLNVLEERHKDLLMKTQQAQNAITRTQRDVERFQEKMGATQAAFAAAQQRILQARQVLAKIDELILVHTEHDTDQNVLRTGTGAVHLAAPPLQMTTQLSWPAYGSLSAGFHDASYEQHFGIPHEGQDILVSEGSPVFSAADGVVLIARDGGMGYSYVLISHEGGFSTLYGHLSKITVNTGGIIHRSDQIGLSGGRVGAPGSGPMTTGPHLHFEVLLHGEHIDPKTVLP